MIAAWMSYATLVAVLACLAAMTAERALRLSKQPARLVWIGAMTLACLVPLVAPWRAPATSLPAVPSRNVLRSKAGEASRSVMAFGPIPSTIAVPRGSALSGLDRPLLQAWFAGSLAWCLVLAASALAVARRRRHWSPSMIDDTPVLISRDVGPAVVGVIRPQTVIPAWVPTLAPAQRALVLAHEHEHARARDPLLLAAGASILVAMPWNAALWYAFGRLRLAVEADCDRRVLQTHPDAHAYSSLLVDVTERNLRNTLHLAALGASRSQLARRLALLTERVPRQVTARVLGAALFSLTCVIVACKTPQPAAVSRDSGIRVGPSSAAAMRTDTHVASTHDPFADRSTISEPRVTLPRQFENKSRSDTGTLIRVSKSEIEEALLASGIRSDSMLTPDDIRGLVLSQRARQAMPRPAEDSAKQKDLGIPSSVIRRAVETHFPEALSGRMGRGPHLWFLADRMNRVLRFASGREGLGVDDVPGAITWGSVVRMLPGTPESMQRRGDLLQLELLPVRNDTVVVVWARLWGESSAR